MAVCGTEMSSQHAFYYVVDERLEPVAFALACHLVRTWRLDVHIFVEGGATSAKRRAAVPGVYYHENELSCLLPDGVPSSEKWPRIVYLRIFAPRFLKQYERVIYLDADLLPIRRDDRIWSLPLPHGLAATHDFEVTHDSPLPEMSRTEWLASIGVHAPRYLNSGVLVIDVAAWLELDFAALLQDYVAAHANGMRMFDQDFLNAVFQERWSGLSPSWNFQACLFSVGIDDAFPPIFLHFSKPDKPWMGRFREGVDDLDNWGYQYLSKAARRAGVDMNGLLSPKKINVLSRLKYDFRRHISGLGYRPSKERKLRGEVALRRENLIAYLADVKARGGFADRREYEIPSSFREAVFDGKTLRLPAGGQFNDLLMMVELVEDMA